MVKSKRARDAVEAVGSENQNGARPADEPSSKKRKQNDESADVSSTKKAKKDKKDKNRKGGETRKEKKDKRKDLQDLPEADEPEEEEEVAAPVKEEKPKKEKKEKKDKKDKKDKAASEDKAADAETPKKENKDKKSKKEKKAEAAPTNGDADDSKATENGNGIDLDESTAKKNDRHIVFVGNLPYTATVASISSHFATLKPVAVRCLTNKFEKDPKVTCKGIAFVEFANVWTQKTCLDKFHHSMFDDKMSAPRKINVELTAGGGGKTQHRQDKIMEKNKKLDENRAKRIEREKTAKTENASASQQHLEDSIHPSRRGRVPGAGY